MFLADTDVVSEPKQKSPSPQVMAWLRENDENLFLSAITVAELRKGVELYPASKKKNELSAWLDGLLEDFEGCILPFTDKEALTWAKLYAKAQKAGRKPPSMDSLNAAIALHHDLTLATRNEKDYIGTGVKTVNPWND